MELKAYKHGDDVLRDVYIPLLQKKIITNGKIIIIIINIVIIIFVIIINIIESVLDMLRA